MTHVDLEKKREYDAKWRANNKDKKREYNAKWYKKNKHKKKKISAIWYGKNSEKQKEYTKSYNRDVIKASPENKIRRLIVNARSRAKKNGLDFCITTEDVLVAQWCPLLGIKICYSNNTTAPNSPSIDRIDPSRGYVPGNVWIISHKANTVKNDMSLGQLEVLVANLRAEIESREI